MRGGLRSPWTSGSGFDLLKRSLAGRILPFTLMSFLPSATRALTASRSLSRRLTTGRPSESAIHDSGAN